MSGAMQRKAGPAADGPGTPERVGWGFIVLYAVSYTGGSLLFLAPLLVSLALKVNDLVGIDAAPRNLSLVTGVGSLLAIVANPLFGRLSDRTTSRVGMRRPWMVTASPSARPARWSSPRPRTSRPCSSAGASAKSSSTPPWPPRPLCCPTRYPANNAGWSPASSDSASPPRRWLAPTWCRRSTPRPS